MDPSISVQTLEAVRQALSAPMPAMELAKATATTAGVQVGSLLYGYNLEAPAKTLVPILTPLRNRFPRKGGGHGTAVEWKAVIAVNATHLSPGVAEGSRGTTPSIGTATFSAGYRTLGFPGIVTMQAIWAGQDFDDALNRGTVATLQTTMLGEEQTLVGGNVTALGMPGALTFLDTVPAANGALTPSATYYYAVSALTLQGQINGAVGAVGAPSADAIGESTARTGSHTCTGSGPGSTATILNWPAVRGAVGYNVFVGTTSTVKYRATVTANTYTLASAPSGTGNVPNAADQTADATVFNGVIAQIEASASGAYFLDAAGAKLTADNAGGVVEIDVLLKYLWDTARLGPRSLLVNSQEALTITKAVLTSGTTGAMRAVVTPGPGGTLQAGFFVDSYLNKFVPGGRIVSIEIHPNMPAGKIVAIVEALPAWFPNNNVASVFEVDVRQEYIQLDFAMTQLQKEFGVYVDEVLKCYLPAGCGVITGITGS
jgi:hypothetical protein